MIGQLSTEGIIVSTWAFVVVVALILCGIQIFVQVTEDRIRHSYKTFGKRRNQKSSSASSSRHDSTGRERPSSSGRIASRYRLAFLEQQILSMEDFQDLDLDLDFDLENTLRQPGVDRRRPSSGTESEATNSDDCDSDLDTSTIYSGNSSHSGESAVTDVYESRRHDQAHDELYAHQTRESILTPRRTVRRRSDSQTSNFSEDANMFRSLLEEWRFRPLTEYEYDNLLSFRSSHPRRAAIIALTVALQISRERRAHRSHNIEDSRFYNGYHTGSYMHPVPPIGQLAPTAAAHSPYHHRYQYEHGPNFVDSAIELNITINSIQQRLDAARYGTLVPVLPTDMTGDAPENRLRDRWVRRSRLENQENVRPSFEKPSISLETVDSSQSNCTYERYYYTGFRP
ncbi:hypothetical protein V1511DRAFT_487096 [Dipodascopsis uninucleata]